MISIKPVMKNATVILIADAEIGGQCMLAISREGALFLPGAPGSGATAVSIELPALRDYFTSGKGSLDEEISRVALDAVAEAEREAS